MNPLLINEGQPDQWLAEGFIYVASTPSIENWVKVGFSKNYWTRLKQLNTAVPEPFSVRALWAVSDMRRAEQICHRALDTYRAGSRREFFGVNTDIGAAASVENGVYVDDVEALADYIHGYMAREYGLTIQQLQIAE